MNAGFLFNVIWAFALIALLLWGMTFIARGLQRGRLVSGSGRRLVSTIESTMLAQNVTVHVVKVANKYYLLGGGAAGVAMIAELPTDEIEPYIDAQRVALAQQRESLMRPFARFKKS